MSKSTNLIVRIEPEVKVQAEAILSKLGVSSSSAINMFFKQIILQDGLPFDIKIPSHPLNIDDLTDEELEKELKKRYEEIKEDKTKSFKDVCDGISNKYKL